MNLKTGSGTQLFVIIVVIIIIIIIIVSYSDMWIYNIPSSTVISIADGKTMQS